MGTFFKQLNDKSILDGRKKEKNIKLLSLDHLHFFQHIGSSTYCMNPKQKIYLTLYPLLKINFEFFNTEDAGQVHITSIYIAIKIKSE